MSTLNLLAVFVENKPGQTARVTGIIAGAGVNLRWITVASSGAFGVMKFLVDKREQAVQSLTQQGLMVSLLEVLGVEVENKPGTLQAVAELLQPTTSTWTTVPVSSPTTALSLSLKPTTLIALAPSSKPTASASSPRSKCSTCKGSTSWKKCVGFCAGWGYI